MVLRFTFWLRHFWFVIPALAVAMLMGVLFWDFGFSAALIAALGGGVGTLVALAMIGAAWGR